MNYYHPVSNQKKGKILVWEDLIKSQHNVMPSLQRQVRFPLFTVCCAAAIFLQLQWPSMKNRTSRNLVLVLLLACRYQTRVSSRTRLLDCKSFPCFPSTKLFASCLSLYLLLYPSSCHPGFLCSMWHNLFMFLLPIA